MKFSYRDEKSRPWELVSARVAQLTIFGSQNIPQSLVPRMLFLEAFLVARKVFFT